MAEKCGCNKMIKSATIATLAMFITFKRWQVMEVKIIPIITISMLGSLLMYTQQSPTIEPIKLDLTRSLVSLLESFPSGEITKIIESSPQNNSY